MARRQHGAVHHARRPAERRCLGFVSGPQRPSLGSYSSGGFFRLRPGPDRETPIVDSQFGYRDGDEYGLPSPWVFQLFEASDGRFWVATARGLAEFLDTGDTHHRFRSYTKRNGLSYFDITAVNEDLGATSGSARTAPA